MRALVHGSDSALEDALRERGVELVRDGHADALLTLAPPASLGRLSSIAAGAWKKRFVTLVDEPFAAFQTWLRDVLDREVAGRWVAVTSVLGAQPFPFGGLDGSAAVALQTLVRIAALEYGPRGIRANAVAPGWRSDLLPAELDASLALVDTPTGRLTDVADVASAVVWLLSDEAEQVNGEVLRVDGGYSITRGSRPDPTNQAGEP